MDSPYDIPNLSKFKDVFEGALTSDDELTGSYTQS